MWWIGGVLLCSRREARYVEGAVGSHGSRMLADLRRTTPFLFLFDAYLVWIEFCVFE